MRMQTPTQSIAGGQYPSPITGTSSTPGLHEPSQVRQDVDNYLRDFYTRQRQAAGAADQAYVVLWQAMTDLAFAGGKRLRPYLTVLSYEMYGGTDYPAIIPVAAAQELLHLSLLIHDDISDRDIVRYGVDNISGRFLKLYQQRGAAATEARHLADSAALLAGDLLLSAAHLAIADSSLPAASRQLAQHLLGEATFWVAAGQLLDIETTMDAMETTDTFKIARLKTASYSFNGPLKTGAVLAGVPASECDLLTELGDTVGLAYQLADDLLGVFGDQKLTGKPNLTDLQEGKRTYLMQLAFEMATDRQRKVIEPLFGDRRLTNQQADVIREVIVSSGAKQAVEQVLDEQRQLAEAQVAGLNASAAGRQYLLRLIEKAVRRNR